MARNLILSIVAVLTTTCVVGSAFAKDPVDTGDSIESAIAEHIQKQLDLAYAESERCSKDPTDAACVASRQADREELAAVLDIVKGVVPLDTIIADSVRLDTQREMLEMVEDACENPDNPACKLALDAYDDWKKGK